MKSNVSLVDRTVRFGAGMALVATPLLELRTYPYNLVGVALVITAAAGFCPLYGLLSVFKRREREQPLSVAHYGA
jgi:hypothetical protein